MQAPRNWRQLLGKILEDPKEKRRLADTLGVSERTLERWATEVSNPRSISHVRQLLKALPKHRELLTELLRQEFPDEVEQAIEEQALFIDEVVKVIPAPFYTRILETHATTVEPVRSWSICNMVLHQLAKHLDLDHLGIEVHLVQCLPPSQDQKVHSLLHRFKWETAPLRELPKEQAFYAGSESLAGSSITKCLPEIIQDLQHSSTVPSIPQIGQIRSAAAYPIQRAGRVAGSILVLSPQAHFFTPARLTLIQHYSYLLALAFNESDFYAIQDIELRLMPSESMQQTFLSTLNERINAVLSRAEQNGQLLTRPQAELVVLQEIEAAFVQHSMQLEAVNEKKSRL